jgi:hypothetical protein
MLIVDSPYHPPAEQIPPSSAEPKLDDLPELVKKSFELAEKMLETWELPKWDGPACGDKLMRFTAGGEDLAVRAGSAQHKPLDGRWQALKTTEFKHDYPSPTEKPILPPPAVMIRCVLSTPIATPADDGPLQVDMFRGDPFLGWSGGGYPGFIKAVIDTNAGHYDVFKFSHVRNTLHSAGSKLTYASRLKRSHSR